MRKINKSNPNVKRFVNFMKERHLIYMKRMMGSKYPWTQDPILNTYSFTNVFREFDRVTVWVNEHIREVYWTHPHLWFMLCIARQINWPETLDDLILADVFGKHTWPTINKDGIYKWDWKAALKVMRNRKKAGKKVYTGAYILNAQWGNAPLPKGEVKDKPLFTCYHVLREVWNDRAKLEPIMHTSMQNVVEALSGKYRGWGGFMAYEVACDLRHTRYLRKAPDIMTYAHAGPGARRGLNRLMEKELYAPMSVAEVLANIQTLLPIAQTKFSATFPSKKTPRLEMREIEHSLCEFDKYERVRLGEGRPRAKFVPPHLRVIGE